MAQRPYIIWSLGPKALAALACDHLFQAPGMASLVDAAIFLQDKQQTFQQTDDGIIDHQQNYWAKLFDRHSQIVDVPAMTIQTTNKIVEPVDEQSMLTTYRMGRIPIP